MPLEYSKAKNESLTCKYNDIYLHSSYNPENEALRFVQNINPDYTPDNIIVIEPALSYCADFLRTKFPSSKIYAIRFIDNIKSVQQFDKDFLFSDNADFEDQLFNFFGEAGLLNSFFISWPASSKAFADKDSKLWSLLKRLLKQCQDILATRQYFSERWIKNQINYFLNLRNITVLSKINLPVIICGSGPSLNNCIKFLKSNSDNFFVIACSSSIKPLLINGIKPDLCISTDGGYWAKKHLNCLKGSNSVIALPAEANIKKELLQNITLLPLAYSDNFDNEIFDTMKIPFMTAKRNGTVTGTALDFAITLTDNTIFLCGIDLESSSGYVHTQPNELESTNSLSDNKIKSKEKRIYLSGRETPQLDIYRNWFITNSHNLKNRVFRISEDHTFLHKLGQIKDINTSDIFNLIKIQNCSEKKNYFTPAKRIQCNPDKIKDMFIELSSNPVWVENYFPADCMMIKRFCNTELENKYRTLLKEKIDSIISFIQNQVEE